MPHIAPRLRRPGHRRSEGTRAAAPREGTREGPRGGLSWPKPEQPVGATMKWVIALFAAVLLLCVGAAPTGLAVWASRISHHDHHDLRTIHYGTNYDMSAQRRQATP